MGRDLATSCRQNASHAPLLNAKTLRPRLYPGFFATPGVCGEGVGVGSLCSCGVVYCAHSQKRVSQCCSVPSMKMLMPRPETHEGRLDQRLRPQEVTRSSVPCLCLQMAPAPWPQPMSFQLGLLCRFLLHKGSGNGSNEVRGCVRWMPCSHTWLVATYQKWTQSSPEYMYVGRGGCEGGGGVSEASQRATQTKACI